ncbi:MAG: AraC family transcriptional regulator ligand-binding domain-containing protein [Alphaproteobacteria bacterium]
MNRRSVPETSDKPGVLATVASTIVAFALSRGISIHEIETATGLSGLDLVHPDARLPEDVIAALWDMLVPSDPEVALSMELARAAPFSFFGGLVHGAQFAKDLRTVLHLMVKTRRFMADRLHMALEEQGGEATLTCAHPMVGADRGRTAEVGAGIFTRMISDVLGIENSLVRVEFFHPPSGPTKAYLDFFQTEVHFERPANAIVLKRDCLDLGISQSNAELFAFVEQYYDGVLRRLDCAIEPPGIARLRKAVVEAVSNGCFEPISVAARMNVSLRSAQRIANGHGTSIQALINDRRAQSAMDFLQDPEVDIHAIALLLGYSDDRAFRRAFKRWTGRTPSEFRKAACRPALETS